MTPPPQPPSPANPPRKSTSGSSARPLTIKQQREQKRAQKLAAFKKEQARQKRNHRVALFSGIGAGVLVVALLITWVVVGSGGSTRPNYTAGGNGAVVPGVQTFTNVSNHTSNPVTYPQNPPTGGDHSPVWLNCGVYNQPVPNENAVHALEHGAVWVAYDPATSAADIQKLRDLLPSSLAILSPVAGMASPVTVTGWNKQLGVPSASDPNIQAFIGAYWQGKNAPEPGASCSGGLSAPGKVG